MNSKERTPKVIIMKAVSSGSDAINMAIQCCHNSLTKFCYEHQIDPAEFTKVCQHKTECKYNANHSCIWVNLSGPVYCGFMKKLGLEEDEGCCLKDDDFEFIVGSPEDRVKLVKKIFHYVYIKSRYENLNLIVPQMLFDEHAKGVSIIKQFKIVSKSRESKKPRKRNGRKLSKKTVLNLVSQLTARN